MARFRHAGERARLGGRRGRRRCWWPSCSRRSLPLSFTDPDRLEDNGQIVILSGRDDSLGGQRQQLVNQWNELHPESRARIVELSALADAQRSEMLARAQAGRGDIDVYNLDVTWTAEFAEPATSEPRRVPALPRGFLDGPLATCRYDGRLWALPFNTDVGLLYYRSDLSTTRPADVEGPRGAGRGAPRARSGNDVDGYAGQFADYEGLTVNALEAIGGRAARSSTTRVTSSSRIIASRSLEGLDRLRKIAPAGVPELDEDSSTQLFRSGKALFMRNWPVEVPVAERGPRRDARGDIRRGSPARRLRGARRPEPRRRGRHRPSPAARALIEFLTSERSQQILFERGGLPATRKVVYSDPAVRERYEYVPTLERALEHARPRPAQPHYARFSQVFRSAVDGLSPPGRATPRRHPGSARGRAEGPARPGLRRLAGDWPTTGTASCSASCRAHEPREERRQAIG